MTIAFAYLLVMSLAILFVGCGKVQQDKLEVKKFEYKINNEYIKKEIDLDTELKNPASITTDGKYLYISDMEEK